MKRKIFILLVAIILIGTYIKSISSIPSYYWKQTSGGSVGDFMEFKETYKLHGFMIYKGKERRGVAILHIYDRMIIYSIKDKKLGFYMVI
jgi:hypothetical protein